jgi:hypothetical protein
VCALHTKPFAPANGFISKPIIKTYMTQELIASKIELLQEQIENLERSGFFTESEIDRAVVSLRSELEMYKMHLSYCDLANTAKDATLDIHAFGKAIGLARLAVAPAITTIDPSTHRRILVMEQIEKYGMSDEEYEEGSKKHNELFNQNQAKSIMNINVVAADILTPSYQAVV